ncbi:hypothetical protein FA15DRAFT_653085 [Coprinopsis marcescibilis]|uniref:Uncharacterized protein n=1 Tax=Coprinopsis marcescibilis TaxID=230819 RepID=A0A5C3L6C3_COPMA|nr:hypothetical protein FA15DRAFT_653085 [Coprinopsis marcescibilis]
MKAVPKKRGPACAKKDANPLDVAPSAAAPAISASKLKVSRPAKGPTAAHAAKQKSKSNNKINSTSVQLLGNRSPQDSNSNPESFHLSQVSDTSDGKDDPTNDKSCSTIAEVPVLTVEAQMIKDLQAKIAELEQSSKKVSTKGREQWPKRQMKKTTVKSPANPDNGLGGLNDDNAADIRPTTPSPPPQIARTLGLAGPQSRNLQQMNKTALIFQDPDSHVTAVESAVPKPCAMGVGRTTARKPTLNPLVQATHTKPAHPNSTTVLPPSLPVAARAVSYTLTSNKWKDAFLLTLYHALFCSSQPFTNFTSASPEFHKLVQSIVSEVYPGSRPTTTSPHARMKASSFSQVSWGAAMNGYIVGLNGISHDQWMDIMESCSEVLQVLRSEEIELADEPVENRTNMFSFPSLYKGRVF